MTRTSDVLWLREAQGVDVPVHDPHEEVRNDHDKYDAHAHVQGERAEVNTLKQSTTALNILPLLHSTSVILA
jgi:hypothetical protein